MTLLSDIDKILDREVSDEALRTSLKCKIWSAMEADLERRVGRLSEVNRAFGDPDPAASQLDESLREPQAVR